MTLQRIDQKLKRLQLLTVLILVFGLGIVMAITSFAIYEVAALRAQQEAIRQHQEELEQLTTDLCVTLERAGIILRGSEVTPCAR